MAVISDPITIVHDVVDSWNTGASYGGTKPTLFKADDASKQNLQRGDIIRFYEVGGNHQPHNIGDGLDRVTARISIDMRTKTDRARIRQIYGEVVRLIRASELSPGTDYCLVIPGPRQDFTDKLNRHYRYVLDVNLIAYEAIP